MKIGFPHFLMFGNIRKKKEKEKEEDDLKEKYL